MLFTTKKFLFAATVSTSVTSAPATTAPAVTSATATVAPPLSSATATAIAARLTSRPATSKPTKSRPATSSSTSASVAKLRKISTLTSESDAGVVGTGLSSVMSSVSIPSLSHTHDAASHQSDFPSSSSHPSPLCGKEKSFSTTSNSSTSKETALENATNEILRLRAELDRMKK